MLVVLVVNGILKLLLSHNVQSQRYFTYNYVKQNCNCVSVSKLQIYCHLISSYICLTGVLQEYNKN